MCLITNKEYKVQKNETIRYKVVIKVRQKYHSLYQRYFNGSNDTSWKLKKTNKNPTTEGFHVLVRLKEARFLKKFEEKEIPGRSIVILKVSCDEFVSGGTWDWTGKAMKSEIWKRVTPIEEIE